MDKDTIIEENIAELEISVKELLQLLHNQHGEYFNFDLKPQAQRWPQRAKRGSLPHIAMRIRDVTEMAQTKMQATVIADTVSLNNASPQVSCKSKESEVNV